MRILPITRTECWHSILYMYTKNAVLCTKTQRDRYQNLPSSVTRFPLCLEVNIAFILCNNKKKIAVFAIVAQCALGVHGIVYQIAGNPGLLRCVLGEEGGCHRQGRMSFPLPFPSFFLWRHIADGHVCYSPCKIDCCTVKDAPRIKYHRRARNRPIIRIYGSCAANGKAQNMVWLKTGTCARTQRNRNVILLVKPQTAFLDKPDCVPYH